MTDPDEGRIWSTIDEAAKGMRRPDDLPDEEEEDRMDRQSDCRLGYGGKWVAR